MLRSMYSGISGMKVNQTKLDVIGNNIANVNSTSFKSSRANFADLLSQNTSSAQGASTTKGGTNAKQVGLGVQLASIDKIMTQGSMQTTNRALDVAIDGVGYFMVSTGPAISGDGTLEVSHKAGTHSLSAQSLQSSGSQISYTRDGSFIRDNEGNLLTSSGYRVLGYSLTNDDNLMGATSVSPNNVTINDTLNFTFGPGSQLNGYKIQLGAIGQGTTTSASVDTKDKIITINGDFSQGTALNAGAINLAIKSGLEQAGISQTITVSGKVNGMAEANTSKVVSGGTDATAPGYVTCGGLKFNFTTGAELDGFTFQLDDVSAKIPDAKVDGKVIKISGDFVNSNVDNDTLILKINNALKDAGITQQVTNITGSPAKFTKLTATSGIATVAKAPELSSTKPKSDGSDFNKITSIAGFTIDSSKLSGNDLNGYKVQFVAGTGKAKATVDKDAFTITIAGELDKIVSTITDTSTNTNQITIDQLNTDISNTLSANGINDAGFSLAGSYNDKADKVGYFGLGEDDSSAGNIEVGGFTIETPKASELVKAKLEANDFDNLKIVIGQINEGTTTAKYTDNNTITVSGNFSTLNGVSKEELENAINDAVKEKYKDKGLTTDLISISNSGASNTVYQATKSESISGGSVLGKGNPITALGITFNQAAGGAALNGYKIQLGTISAGTTLGATVSESSKTITVNGDFTKNGLYTADDICKAINKAISNSTLGSGVGFEVDNKAQKANSVSSTESENILGGTSVQSIAADGSVNFVDAKIPMKSYDNSLKTLKIPEKVKIPGTDTELAVKDYSIDANGIIIGNLEDGSRAALGQIAMASFANPEGLTSVGNNLFTESSNSGSALIRSGEGSTGEDNSQGFGTNLQGYLEMSNVDLAEQFTDMIVTTKAFQGSSKMITTGDEILSEIINLKR